MNTYKEISKEEVLNLKEGDFVYYKKNNNDEYTKCMVKYNNRYHCLGLFQKLNNDNEYRYGVVCFNTLKSDDINYYYDNYKFYIKTLQYSAEEILHKINNKELQEDDILIDKNGNEDSIYDILEYSLMTLVDYQPYHIKERKLIKMHYGDEIIKMIREGKFKHNDRLLGYLSNGKQDGEFIIIKNDNATVNIKEVGSYEDDVDSWDLINMKFSIKE
jgi:hypothetical protein